MQKMGTFINACTNGPCQQNYASIVSMYFFVASIIFIILKVSFIYVVGAPLFLGGGRLAAFSEGWGVLFFFEKATVPVITIIAITNILQKNTRLLKIICGLLLIFIVLSAIANGSRSVFLTILFGYYYAEKYIESIEKRARVISNKFIVLLYILTIIFFIFVNVIQWNFSIEEAVLSFFERLFAQGDVYCYFYIGDYFDTDIAGNLSSDFIIPLMAKFRLFDYSKVIPQLGIRMVSYEMGLESASGPNNRINVLSLAAFGLFGAVIFSYCVGWFVAWVRNNSLKFGCESELLTIFVYAYASQVIFFAEQDFYAMLNFIIMSSLINSVLLLGVFIVKYLMTTGDFASN